MKHYAKANVGGESFGLAGMSILIFFFHLKIKGNSIAVFSRSPI